MVQENLAEEYIKFCVPEAEVSLYVCGTAWQVEVTVGCEVEVVPLPVYSFE